MHTFALVQAVLWPILWASTVVAVEFPQRRGIEVSLFTGIPGYMVLGDSKAKVLKSITQKPDSASSLPEGMDKLNISELAIYRDLGIRAYFRQNHVVLIEIQQPFTGPVRGKKMFLFNFVRPPGKTWEEFLEKLLGAPLARAAGGKFGAKAMYYNWGDVSFNNMGPNQIAIYRDTAIHNYRLKHFGSGLELFEVK